MSVGRQSSLGEPPLGHSDSSKNGYAEARKKKSVTWDVEEMDDEPGASVSDGISEADSSFNIEVGKGGPLLASRSSNARWRSTEEPSMDHLRVRSTRPGCAEPTRLDNIRSLVDHQGSMTSAPPANFGRNRCGERVLEGGAVRVRTPAKPKRSRPDLTLSSTDVSNVAAKTSPSTRGIPQPRPALTITRGVRAAPRPFLRRGGGSILSSPKSSPAKMSPTIKKTSPTKTASPPKASPVGCPRRVWTDVNSTATVISGIPFRSNASSSGRSSPLRLPCRSPRAEASATPRRRPYSVDQALRSVAGGCVEDGEPLGDVQEEENGEVAASEESPVSKLSSTLSSIGIAGTDGKPPLSHKVSVLPGNEQHSKPNGMAVATKGVPAGDSFRRHSSIGGGIGQAARGDEHNEGQQSRSISVAKQELSEEPRLTVSTSCPCRHDDDCEVAALGGPLQGGGRNASSIEVRTRLKELQERNSALEQEKINLTMALVPLEARLESKERAWEAERKELLHKAEENHKSLKEAEGRCSELEKERSEIKEDRQALDAELRRLRGEIKQKESKTAESFWQRSVAADREKMRLETELDQAQAKVVTLTSENTELEARMSPVQSELVSLRIRLSEAEKVASRVLTAEESLRFSQTQLEVMKTEFAATSAQLAAVLTELAQQKASARKQLEETERKASEDVASLRSEMQRLQQTICNQADRVVAAGRMEQAIISGSGSGTITVTDGGAALVSSEAARIRHQELANLRTELEQERERTRFLQEGLDGGEKERRSMHNVIQDLKGSVRVYVRTRPFLKSDGQDPRDHVGPDTAVVRCGSDGSSVTVIPPDAPNRLICDGVELQVGLGPLWSRGLSCAFDHAFGGHASQEDVFKEVSGFVQSALDGFKVCLFSYGQTGSGKTHTMMGSGTGMMRGIIPRAVEHILARVGELQDGPWRYRVQASFLEIYNEQLRDLLAGGSEVRHGSGAANMAIKRGADGSTEVVGLNKISIDTGDQKKGLAELEQIMSVAQRARSVARTAMNAQSSRSHSVFTLWLSGSDVSTGTTLKGALHLVDLAGSERLNRSGVASDAKRLRETRSINKSLSCLADVFSALSSKSPHVPFRNSKLTFLMQDCLSGDGKALMFVNLSPTAASAGETVCSLRFASQVSQVELGRPARQLNLSNPTGSRSGCPPSGGSNIPRPSAPRAARASGSGASNTSASTAPPSPRTSGGSANGGGNNGGGPTRSGSSKLEVVHTASSLARTKRGATVGGGVASRIRFPSSDSPGSLGTKSRGILHGPVAGRGTGRSSVSGSRLLPARGGRKSGEGQVRKGGGSRVVERPPGGRSSFSGATRPLSAVARSVPPSPRRGADEKRLRLSPG